MTSPTPRLTEIRARLEAATNAATDDYAGWLSDWASDLEEMSGLGGTVFEKRKNRSEAATLRHASTEIRTLREDVEALLRVAEAAQDALGVLDGWLNNRHQHYADALAAKDSLATALDSLGAGGLAGEGEG